MDSPLLAQRIPLATVSYARYTSSSPDHIELARRSVLPLLASVHIPELYLFSLSPAPIDRQFDGLQLVESSSFSLPFHSHPLISHFLHAVRTRIIDHTVAASLKAPSLNRHLRRFKNGVLITQLSQPSDWDYKPITRPLILCHLQIQISCSQDGTPTHLVVHPMLTPSPFLDIARALPLPSGTPITLLPYGTPAYFLATYSGPTSALVKQFHSSLQGLGAGNWEENFIIAWIKVENKQGEDKGITIIYPTTLCLSYIPSRAPLDYIPELPTPLQPSPPPQHAAQPQPLRRPSIFSSPTSDSLNSFRALTVSKSRDLRQVATEVGGYVDAVARERDRERERLKRERESSTSTGSPKMSRTSVTTPASASAPTPVSVIETPTPTPSAPITIAGTSTQQPIPIHNQNFYPSPPHIVPATNADAKTSPIAETIPGTPAEASSPAPPPPPSGSSTASTAYDPYTMDSTWAQPSYLGMDIDNMDFGMDDIGMNFGMNMGANMANSSSGGGRGAGGGYATEQFEDTFTEDDFDFFDRPSRPAATPAGPHSRVASGSGPIASLMSPSVGTSPPHFGEMHAGMSGPGPPSNSHQTWTPSGFLDGFTPRSMEHTDSVPPELMPSSSWSPGHQTQTPATTPGDPLVPITPKPNVHLEYPYDLAVTTTRSSTTGSTRFEPIPFAEYHRKADGKYAVGKFAFSLPSPPAEEEMHISPPPSAPPGSGSSTLTPLQYQKRGKRHSGLSLPGIGASAFQQRGTSDSGQAGWRFRYEAATDPRIGVVRKLVGVKRKMPFVEPELMRKGSFEQRMRSGMGMSWGDAHEEWEEEKHAEENGEKSEVDSEEDEDEDGDEDIDSPMMSRPSTPPPAYLPLGPTLLHAQFTHAQLLPLSVPLRPPGAAVAPINLMGGTNSNPQSVPTPVSPAAMMGAASEKSKSLEAAGWAIAAEVVENPVWAETWRAASVPVGFGMGKGMESESRVWAADVRAVGRLLEGVGAAVGVGLGVEEKDKGVGMKVLFGLEKENLLQPLEEPMISIGKGDAIVQMKPPALRFWEKLGLDPKGGRKDLAAFVLFEVDDGEQLRGEQVENWLGGVRNVYQSKHYGTMSLGKSGVCQRDGMVPLRFDATFRKSLTTFIASLGPPQPTTVIFLILPVTVMSLSSPVLRQILSVSKKVLGTFSASQIFFQFIPEPHIFCALEKSSAYDSALDLLAASVYNRVLVPVDRLVSSRSVHRLADDGDSNHSVRRLFMAPSFTLARPLHGNKVSYVRAAHASLDVMDRWTLLHVAYHLTACGKWIVACCVDQRGEAYDLRAWLTKGPGEQMHDAGGGSEGHGNEAEHEGEGEGVEVSEEEYAVKKVWEFGMELGKKANVEWRMVFARLGMMSEKEMNAWSGLLNENVVNSKDQPPLHHSLVCVIPDASWLFIPSKSNASPLPVPRSTAPSRSSSSSKPLSVFTDISSTTYAIYPTNRISISIPPSQGDLGLSQSFIPEVPASISSSPTSPHPQSQSNTIRNPSAIAASSSSSSADASSSSSAAYLPHPVTFLPQATSILIRSPHSSSSSSISMTHIHLLRTVHSASYTHSTQASSSSSSRVPDNEQLLRDMTRNYHELEVLSKARWKLDGAGGHKGLPFHVAAVDAMRMALERDWDRPEGGVE